MVVKMKEISKKFKNLTISKNPDPKEKKKAKPIKKMDTMMKLQEKNKTQQIGFDALASLWGNPENNLLEFQANNSKMKKKKGKKKG